jgi:hypothetical protein
VVLVLNAGYELQVVSAVSVLLFLFDLLRVTRAVIDAQSGCHGSAVGARTKCEHSHFIDGVPTPRRRPVDTRQSGSDGVTGEMLEENGAPGTIRTSDPQIRSLMLYPAELRARLALQARARNLVAR